MRPFAEIWLSKSFVSTCAHLFLTARTPSQATTDSTVSVCALTPSRLTNSAPTAAATPVQDREDEDDPHSEGYEIDVGRVTGEDCRKAQRQAEIYLAWKAKGRAPTAMAHPARLRSWARPPNIPPKSQDTVVSAVLRFCGS